MRDKIIYSKKIKLYYLGSDSTIFYEYNEWHYYFNIINSDIGADLLLADTMASTTFLNSSHDNSCILIFLSLYKYKQIIVTTENKNFI